MRLATSEQCREIDHLSVEVYGLTNDILMESAGTLAAREIQLNFFPELSRGNVAIVCGPGNNGGDGFVVARHLHSMGFRDLTVFYVAPGKKPSELCRRQMERANLHGIRVVDVSKSAAKLEAIKSSQLIVDALLGIGFRGKLQPGFLKAIELMNAAKAAKVSLDMPSGLNANTGVVGQAAVRAAMTLTFGLAKPGFFVGDGPTHVSKLRILPIGYPHESLRGVATSHFLFNDRLAKRYLPKRKNTGNKSDYGRLVVAAGSEASWGAGILASHSAYRMGAGYVYWASHENPLSQLVQIPEVITRPLNSDDLWDQEKISAWVVGPGLGVSGATRDLLLKLKQAGAKKVVVDADAITVAVKEKLFPFPETWILTPHAGELSRIIGWDSREIEDNRYEAALEGAKRTGCHLLLKGYRSVLAYQNRAMVINSGNSALSKAGTGDVLAGMVGSLLAQGMDTLQGTATAAYVHGRLAEEWVRKGHDRATLMPSDIKDELPSLLARIAAAVVF